MENNFPELTQDQLDLIAILMDDETREIVHIHCAPCHPGEFLSKYLDLAERMGVYDAQKLIDQFETGGNNE